MKLTETLNNVVLLEGRVEDARQYIERSIGTTILSDESEETLQYFMDSDPSGNHKYLMWMVKMHDTDSGFSPNMLQDMVGRFHKNVDRLTPALVSDMGYYSGSNVGVSPKNIESYNDYRTLKKVVEKVESIQTRKEKEKTAKEGVDKLYEDDRWLLVKPNTYEGSCYYGSSTKWCTASKDAPQHFESYSKTGNLYYIIDKTRNSGDFFKIALHKDWNGQEDWYDRADNELTQETEDAVRSLLPVKLIHVLEDDHEHRDPLEGDKFTYNEFRDKLKSYVQNTRGIQLKTKSGVWDLDFSQENWEWTGPDPMVVIYATPFSSENGNDGLEIYADYDNNNRGEMDIDVHIPYHQLTHPTLAPEEYLDKNPPNTYQPGHTNVEGNLKRFLMHIYLPKVKEVLNNPELVEFVGGGYTTWEPNSYVSSFQFNYPPRKGTMTQKFVDYLKSHPRQTSNQFYEDVLGYPRPRAHNNMFFSSIKDSGIVKMERQGRQFVYSLGPNYAAWTKGNLLRTNKKYGQL